MPITVIVTRAVLIEVRSNGLSIFDIIPFVLVNTALSLISSYIHDCCQLVSQKWLFHELSFNISYRNNEMGTIRVTETDHGSQFEPALKVTQEETAQQP